jgi:hypothetical protein
VDASLSRSEFLLLIHVLLSAGQQFVPLSLVYLQQSFHGKLASIMLRVSMASVSGHEKVLLNLDGHFVSFRKCLWISSCLRRKLKCT